MKSIAERKKYQIKVVADLQQDINSCECPQEHRVSLGTRRKGLVKKSWLWGKIELTEEFDVLEQACMLCGAKFEQEDEYAPAVKTHTPVIQLVIK